MPPRPLRRLTSAYAAFFTVARLLICLGIVVELLLTDL